MQIDDTVLILIIMMEDGIIHTYEQRNLVLANRWYDNRHTYYILLTTILYNTVLPQLAKNYARTWRSVGTFNRFQSRPELHTTYIPLVSGSKRKKGKRNEPVTQRKSDVDNDYDEMIFVRWIFVVARDELGNWWLAVRLLHPMQTWRTSGYTTLL